MHYLIVGAAMTVAVAMIIAAWTMAGAPLTVRVALTGMAVMVMALFVELFRVIDKQERDRRRQREFWDH